MRPQAGRSSIYEPSTLMVHCKASCQTGPTGTADEDLAIVGSSTINGGTMNLASDTASAVITNANQAALTAAGTHAIETDAGGFTLEVAAGSAALTNVTRGWIRDLMGGIGGFASASQAAVVSDGAGPRLLLGSGWLDFVGLPTGSFSAQPFVVHWN